MSRTIQRFICLIILAIAYVQLSYASDSDLQQGLDKIIAHALGNPHVALKVQSMETGKILYNRDSDSYFLPASVLKTITASAALLYLGPNYHFHTLIYTDNKTITAGKLLGNVYFVFNGDPLFKTEDLQAMVQQLKAKGITQINGNVYIDYSGFSGQRWGHGWMWDDKNTCFSTGVTPLVINHNCFQVKVKGGKRDGAASSLQLFYPMPFTPVINETKTEDKKPQFSPDYCPLDVDVSDDNRYYLSGCIAPGREYTLSFGIQNVSLYARQLLQQLFAQEGIKIASPVNVAVAKNKYLLVDHESKPLSDLLHQMLKKSDNLISDTLLKTMGRQHYGGVGSWYSGVTAVKTVLEQDANIDLSKDMIVDGSGLSRYDLITADQLSHLLNFMYHNEKVGKYFINDLPIAGVDGSLKYRSNPVIYQNVRAKTGTMQGVLALAGYIQTRQNHIVSFVLLMNGFTGKFYPYYFLESDIEEYLVKNA